MTPRMFAIVGVRLIAIYVLIYASVGLASSAVNFVVDMIRIFWLLISDSYGEFSFFDLTYQFLPFLTPAIELVIGFILLKKAPSIADRITGSGHEYGAIPRG